VVFAITSQLEAERKAGRTPAPWAANLVVHSSNLRLQQDLDLVVKYRAPLVITALGSPRHVIDAVHSYGGFVFADVVTPALARKAVEAGADGLVLVCAGAGGHTGALAAPAFIAEVRQFWDGPVALSGAVANGEAIRSYQVLGADLVYMGTRFIAAGESLADPAYKQMVVDCSARDIMTTNAFTGANANYMKLRSSPPVSTPRPSSRRTRSTPMIRRPARSPGNTYGRPGRSRARYMPSSRWRKSSSG